MYGIEYKNLKKDWGCASMLAGIQQQVYLKTDIHKFSFVLHCFSWNVPSSDTNKHKENILEKDIQMYCHQAAKILQFSILHYYDMFFFLKKQTENWINTGT